GFASILPTTPQDTHEPVRQQITETALPTGQPIAVVISKYVFDARITDTLAQYPLVTPPEAGQLGTAIQTPYFVFTEIEARDPGFGFDMTGAGKEIQAAAPAIPHRLIIVDAGLAAVTIDIQRLIRAVLDIYLAASVTKAQATATE